MILLCTDSDKYYSVEVKDIVELVKVINDLDLVIKVFSSEEGMSPHEYIDEYPLFINNDSAVIHKQIISTEGLQLRPVLIEPSWKKKVLPTVPMSGPSFFLRVYDLDREGQMLEDYYLENSDMIISSIESHIYKIEKDLSIDERLMRNTINSSVMLGGSSNRNTDSLTDLTPILSDKLNSLMDEMYLFNDFLTNFKYLVNR